MFYLWIIFLIFIDLFTKFIAKNDLQVQKNLVGDFLYLKYVENIWIAFSIPLTGIALKILTIVLIWVIFWYYYTEEKKKEFKIDRYKFYLCTCWSSWKWIWKSISLKSHWFHLTQIFQCFQFCWYIYFCMSESLYPQSYLIK